MIWRKPGVCHESGEPCTLLRLQIPCAPLRRCRSMESFRVKAARQSTGPTLGDSSPLSPVRNGPFDLPASFKTNYNTPTRMSPSLEALKISKNPGASSNHAFAVATTAPDERTLPHSNQRASRPELESACPKSRPILSRILETRCSHSTRGDLACPYR